MATAIGGPRVLLRQLRETMAEPLASQDRLDKIVGLIAENMHADVCSNCHPFYTGKQKILDTGGRVAKIEARYGKK